MLAQAVNTPAPEGPHQHHVASHRQSYIAHATMPDASTEDKVCPGCQLSVMNENGGVVISFGSSFFHVDCFKCAKCHNTVTADTNLLLLSDGQPVCSNCSYSCSVCHLPILDEAIMTGDDSYHAHCFKCKSCGNRIDELMFAKTHNGIYCMNCHNQRVARSRRHAAKQKEQKEREAREREQRERAGSASVAGSASSRDQLVREHSSPAVASPRPSTAQSPAMSREPSALGRRPSLDTMGRSQSGPSTHASPSSTPNPMVSPIYERFMRSSPSRPSSPQVTVGPNEQAIDPSSAPSPQNGSEDHLSPPVSAKEVARKPSNDRGVRELYKKHDATGSQTNLSLPSAKGRSSKRNSINPGMAFDIDTAVTELGYAIPAGASSSGRGSPTPMHALSPQTPSSGLSAPSPITRMRAESSPKPSTSTASDFPMRPALNASHTMDRVPQAPQALSPAGPRMRPQRSFDTRDNGREVRHTPSLSIDVERSRTGTPSGRTSPGHKVSSPNRRADVPHGIESGTDTDAEGGSDNDQPPAPPAKSPKEPLSAERTPRPERIATTGHAEREGSPGPGSSDESVDQVRTSTFIAPALPPIRISLGAGDFGELLKNYNHTRSGSLAKAGPLSAVDEASPSTELAADRDRERGPSPDTPASNASWRSDITPTTSSGTHATSLEAEPRFQDDASMTTIGATSSGTNSSNGHVGKAEQFPSVADMSMEQPRSRSDSSASVLLGDSTPITVTAPGSTVARPLKVDTSDLVMRRLREALAEAGKRGAMHVNLDQEFVQTILLVLEQRRAEQAELKGKIDHIKRASQQYVDGLTVAQGEYEAELEARRDAEAEVTRLRVLLNGQAARITAMSNDARKGELHKQLSRELSENLTVLERNLSRLRVERDVTIAEVEELETTRSSTNSMPSEPSGGAQLKRSLTMRLDTLKQTYQRELVPLTDERGALLREIAELKAARDIFLEETTMLNARNEELAALNAIYSRRQESAPEPVRTDSSGSSSQGNQADTSMGSSEFVKIQHPNASVVHQAQMQAQQQMQQAQYQAQQQAQALAAQVQRDNSGAQGASGEQGTLRKRGWLAGVRRDAGPGSGSQEAGRITKFKHSFQQISVLRVTRCDHCGDKLWGSQVRCTGCNLSVHHRCQAAVQSTCTPQSTPRKDAAALPLQPSMFGRDLIEQVRADSRGGDRMVPVIVEKCIEAVEIHAIEYEGIYRKTGGSAQNKKITALFERADYDSFDLNDDEQFNDICSVTSVLKTYFRSLPNPLMTFVLHDEFMNTSMIKDPNHKAAKYADLVKQLPTEHYYTLRMLIHHLHRIHEHSAVNLMTARNIGVVFGPTLMRSRNPGAEFSDMAGKALTVEFLVENAPDVFP